MSADELEALRRWKAEALPVIAGLQDLGRALGLQPGTTITGPAAVEAAEKLRAKTARIEAEYSSHVCEVDQLRAKVARVEALVDRWENEVAERGDLDQVYTRGVAGMLRDALTREDR